MNQPAKVYLSQMPSGGLAIFCGGIFGDARTRPDDPRRNLRQRLAGMTPRDRAEMLSLSRKIGAAELSAIIKRQSAWTF